MTDAKEKKRKKRKKLFSDIGAHTARGVEVWNECEMMLRAYIVRHHEQGVPVGDVLLIIHETAGAAAQHAANAITNRLR